MHAHADGVSKSLSQNFVFAPAATVSPGQNIIFRDNDGYRDSAHQSQNEDNFPTFSLGLEFSNEAEREKNNGKGDSALEPSPFTSESEGEMQQSLTERHYGKTKQKRNWSDSTLKGKRNFFSVLKLLSLKLEPSTEKLK